MSNLFVLGLLGVGKFFPVACVLLSLRLARPARNAGALWLNSAAGCGCVFPLLFISFEVVILLSLLVAISILRWMLIIAERARPTAVLQFCKFLTL